MQDFVERMFKERVDLGLKIYSLKKFIDDCDKSKVSQVSLKLLNEQLLSMQNYYDVLVTRINYEVIVHDGE